jgi:hypothetical protein
VVGARRAWGGGRRGRMGREPVWAQAAANVGWMCGPGKDGVSGRVREGGGRVRAAAEARWAGGGWGTMAEAR